MGSDFNGDGRDDILWRDVQRNSYTSWHAEPDGGFVENAGLSSRQVPSDWLVWGLGDFNGDGRDDILWRHDSGIVTNWLGTANGGFTNNHINSVTALPIDWGVAGIGDFNGDGRDDALVRHESGMVSNLLSSPSGALVDNKSAIAVVVPKDWNIAGTGDFNGDGRDDILWRHDGGLVTNWLGTANGGFTNNHVTSASHVSNDWTIEGTGDFNGDGREDVLWRHQFGTIETWLGQADGGFTNNHANSVAGFTSDWRVLQTGDFNGDGMDDILWGDFQSVTSWLGTKAGGFTSNDLAAYAEVDTNWILQPNPTGAGWWDY